MITPLTEQDDMNMLDSACRAWLGPDPPEPAVVDGRFFWYGGFSRSDYIFARVIFPSFIFFFLLIFVNLIAFIFFYIFSTARH